jgi:hypothetical protein
VKYSYSYACAPHHFTITAKKIDKSSRAIQVDFLINDKISLSLKHELNTYTPTREIIDAHVARLCTFIKGTSEKYIQDRMDSNFIMGAINLHRFLREVRTKSGKLVWKR